VSEDATNNKFVVVANCNTGYSFGRSPVCINSAKSKYSDGHCSFILAYCGKGKWRDKAIVDAKEKVVVLCFLLLFRRCRNLPLGYCS
jgi:hypothetical protein